MFATAALIASRLKVLDQRPFLGVAEVPARLGGGERQAEANQKGDEHADDGARQSCCRFSHDLGSSRTFHP